MSGVVETAMRGLSYLFHLGLGLVLLGLSLTVLLSPDASFNVGILPWQGETLAWILLMAGLVGVAAVFLAMKGVLPVLLLVWSVAVLVVLGYGYILSRFHFGRDGPGVALVLLAGAAVATVGGWKALRAKPRRGRLLIDERAGRDWS